MNTTHNNTNGVFAEDVNTELTTLTTEPKNETPANEGFYVFLDKLTTIILPIAIVILAIITGYNVYTTFINPKPQTYEDHIIGTSMLPSFSDGDRFTYILYDDASDIERGTVVLYHASVLETVNLKIKTEYANNLLIKRVIGLPGDSLYYDDSTHTLYINNEEYNEPYLMAQDYDWDIGTIVVPEGYVFVMGDNRADSMDSRSYGCLPIDEIYGIVESVIKPE